jgi:hypothetical protein
MTLNESLELLEVPKLSTVAPLIEVQHLKNTSL